MSDDPPEKSFAALFEESSRGEPGRRALRAGDIRDVTVAQVGKEAVFVEIDPRSQGFIDALDLQGPDGTVRAAVGDKLRARVVEIDGEHGVRLTPTLDAAAAAGANVRVGRSDEPDGVKIAVGQVVSGEVSRVESYGLFVQIEGTKGRSGRGLVPTVEVGGPRGADLRKAFPLGAKVKVKVLEMTEGKIRLSLRALKDDEERAQFDGFRKKEDALPPAGLGTFADLIKARKGQ